MCDPSLVHRLGTAGVGHFVHEALAVTNDYPLPSPLPATTRDRLVAKTLIIKPACDYLPWSTVTANATWLPHTQVVVFPDAGHQAYNERPDQYAGLVNSFLTEQRLPLPVVRPDIVPDSYRGVR